MNSARSSKRADARARAVVEAAYRAEQLRTTKGFKHRYEHRLEHASPWTKPSLEAAMKRLDKLATVWLAVDRIDDGRWQARLLCYVLPTLPLDGKPSETIEEALVSLTDEVAKLDWHTVKR